MARAVGRENDLVAHKSAWVLWGVPFTVLAVTALVEVGPHVRTGLWTLSLLMAGVACVANARRSARLHCYITGPFFLVLSALSLMHGSGILSLGPWGWTGIGAALFIGAPLLIWAPERIWGRYARGGSSERCC